MIDSVSLSVLKVSQPIGEFFIGSITQADLLRISYTEVRSFIDGTQTDLAGIQRERSTKRVKELSEYVRYAYATFPTSVVLAIDERQATLTAVDGCDGLFKLQVREIDDDGNRVPLRKAAFIIDGQHRLAGFEGQPNVAFDVNVSIFIGADLSDKAEIFGRVNLAQTKVNRSLVYDLFSYAKARSPHKVLHEVVIALNTDDGGPFRGKIKRLGKADPGMGRTQTLAQATVVDGLLPYITSEPEKERNRLFLGLGSPKRRPEAWRRYIFQPFYDQEDDAAIFQLITNYFRAVADRWPSNWHSTENGQVLNRTTGYNALARFLGDAYRACTEEPCVVRFEEFQGVFNRISIDAAELTVEHFRPGSSGSSALYQRILAESSGIRS